MRHAKQVKRALVGSLGVAGIAFGALAWARPAVAPLPPVTAEDGIRIAQQMAAAGSRLDVDALVKFIPQTDRVAYVSDTNPITGNNYRKDLSESYAKFKSLDYHWEKTEAFPISDNAVVFTGWASITTVGTDGKTEAVHAIVTSVFVRDSTGAWKRVISHKSTIKPAK
jgi:ketosteroid isomerase-like protein